MCWERKQKHCVVSRTGLNELKEVDVQAKHSKILLHKPERAQSVAGLHSAKLVPGATHTLLIEIVAFLGVSVSKWGQCLEMGHDFSFKSLLTSPKTIIISYGGTCAVQRQR
jgi:hypothetical protein